MIHPPWFDGKIVKFGLLTKKLYARMLTHPKSNSLEDCISAAFPFPPLFSPPFPSPSAVVKVSVTTITVMLPELEINVFVENSFLSILIEKLQRRGR